MRLIALDTIQIKFGDVKPYCRIIDFSNVISTCKSNPREWVHTIVKAPPLKCDLCRVKSTNINGLIEVQHNNIVYKTEQYKLR